MTWFDILYAAVKGPFANLWPLLVLPFIAGLACEYAARRLQPTRADWRLAAALAAAPGLLFLSLAGVIGWRIATHTHWDPAWQHVVKYQLTMLVAGLIIGRASWRAWRRNAAFSRLAGIAKPPSGRLRSAARQSQVEAHLLPCSEPECFVAGVVSPRVYISAGAVDRLSDPELTAALRHERSHILGRDTAVLAALVFLMDLGWFGRTAVTAYHQARERTADEAAARVAGPVALASALLALTKAPPRPIPAIGIAGTASPAWRLHAILGNEELQTARPFERIFAVAGLAASAGLAAWPSIQTYVIDQLCPCHL